MAQERFTSGWLRGFTTFLYVQQDISVLDLHVRQVKGIVSRAVDKAALRDVLVEVIGPGKSDHLYSARTDNKGEFLINSLPEGSYRFRIACSGFNAVSGQLIVTTRVSEPDKMSLSLPVSN